MIKLFKSTCLSLRSLTMLTFVFLLISVSCSDNKTYSLKTSEQVLEIRKPIHELYKSLKVEDEKTPNFEFIYSLFTKTAKLGYVKDDSLILKSPNEYFSGMKGAIDKGIIKLLHEWEIKGKTEYFGNVAHHLSTYGVYFGTTDSIAERGVTSFQLIRIKEAWKIQSMIWKAEDESSKIPSNYLEN